MMNDTQSVDPFREAGKSFDWRPITRPDLLFEPVAADTRPEVQQVAHYAMLCVAMRADFDETNDIILALQHSERAHGLSRIAGVLAVVAASVENAIVLMPAATTQLGLQSGLATPGLFVGALVEELARIPVETRRFPHRKSNERLRSPRVEFEDCLAGTSVVKQLGLLDEMHPAIARPYSRLVTAFRQQLRREGVSLVDDIARRAVDEAGADATAAPMRFVRGIGEAAQTRSVPLPALWRSYVRAVEAGATGIANMRPRE